MNLLDKAINAIAPSWGMKRAAARRFTEILASGYSNYGANLTKKSTRGWLFGGGSAKEDIEDNIDILRQRSRDIYMGVPTAAAALKTIRTNVIGGGLIPAPQPDADFLHLTEEQTEAKQTEILREFSLWADTPLCDAERIDNFYELQQLAFLSYVMNGDAFILLQRRQDPGQPYTLRLRVVEADQICSPDGYDRIAPCNVCGRDVYRIVQGVETGRDGVVVAYWLRDRHPLADDAYESRPDEWTRIEAWGRETGQRQILHLMSRERAGQLRGVPILAPVIETVKQLGRYTDAEVTAAVLSAMFTVFMKKESPSTSGPFGEFIPGEQQVDSADDSSIELAPGAIVDLRPGENPEFANPAHPNTTYDAFTSSLIKQIGAAMEIPPEVMLKQFTTSYSAARGALNEFWRSCAMQQAWFEADFCRPVYETWLMEAVALGRVNAPGFFQDPAIRKAWCACTWSGPARTNLDPVKEVEAALLRINACISTAQEETAKMTGGDWSKNVRQRLIEAARKREVDEVAGTQEQPKKAREEEDESQA